MITASSSVQIDKPVAEVFAFVADCRNEPKWHSDAIEASGEGPLAVGMKQRWLLKFMGKREMTMEVTRLEPDKLEELTARSALMGMAPTITYSFEQAGSGTRFTRSVKMDAQGIGKLMKPMMRGMVPKRNAAFVQNLKKVLDG